MSNSIGYIFRTMITISLLLLMSACTQEYPQTIPDFTMRLPDTTKFFKSKDIPYGKKSILIWFDPNCRECQIETEYILKKIDLFKEANFYLVTRHSYDDMMVFNNHLKLNEYENIKIGIDTSETIPKTFRIRSVPITLIFNEEKVLNAAFGGKPDFEKLEKLLTEKK